MKVVWNFVPTMSGGPSVMMAGILLMLMLSVDSLASLIKVAGLGVQILSVA